MEESQLLWHEAQQPKASIMQSSTSLSIPIKNQSKNPLAIMAYHNSMHVLIYEGYEDPMNHCFICETIWDVVNMTNEEKQMAQFTSGLHKRALT